MKDIKVGDVVYTGTKYGYYLLFLKIEKIKNPVPFYSGFKSDDLIC